MSLPPRGWVGGFWDGGGCWVQKGAAAKTLLAANSRAPAFPNLQHSFAINQSKLKMSNQGYLIVWNQLEIYKLNSEFIACWHFTHLRQPSFHIKGLMRILNVLLFTPVFSHQSPKVTPLLTLRCFETTKCCACSTWIYHSNAFMFEIFFRALDIFVFFCCTSAFLTALSWLSKWQHQGKNVVEGWRGWREARKEGNCDIRSRMRAAQNTKKGIGMSRPAIKCP